LILDEDLSLHKAFGTWRLKKNYGKEYMGCARSTFVINSKGIIQHALYNVKATGHVDRVLNLLNQSE
jgi:peroxiredoxin Q/BCP